MMDKPCRCDPIPLRATAVGRATRVGKAASHTTETSAEVLRKVEASIAQGAGSEIKESKCRQLSLNCEAAVT